MSGRVPESEAGFQEAVVDLALRCGWRVWHDFDSRRNTAGWPDLVLLRDACLIFAELKSEEGRVTIEQWAWLDALTFLADMIPDATFGTEAEKRYVRVVVWRPSDFDAEIAPLLTVRSSWKAKT